MQFGGKKEKIQENKDDVRTGKRKFFFFRKGEPQK
jgi:hypothetical protein